MDSLQQLEKRYGFLRIINYTTCIGCTTCEEVCSFIHEGRPYIKVYEIVSGYRRPISCFHCSKAPCVTACPTGAMHRDGDGAVIVDTSRCIGCAACLAACPFGIPEIILPGYSTKCNLCEDLRKKGLQPACVAMCPAEAIVWGSSEDVSTKLRKTALTRMLTGLVIS